MTDFSILAFNSPISSCFSLRCIWSPPFLRVVYFPGPALFSLGRRLQLRNRTPPAVCDQVLRKSGLGPRASGLGPEASLVSSGDDGRVELDARPHRRADGDALEIDALCRRGLCPDERVE